MEKTKNKRGYKMERKDLPENSIERLVYDFWDGVISKEELKIYLSNKYTNQEDLVEFIVMLQEKGKLHGICYP